jgi:MerR family transcriptional regulator, Zn(II)-responsive regulator of zntA
MGEQGSLRIGELSARSGVSRDALRYYERLGLMPGARRTSGGFRLYPPGTVDRLRFIKQAQIQGLTLREIRELLGFQDRRCRERCRQVLRLLTRKLADVEGRLQQLQEFRQTLRTYLSQCERALNGEVEEECPVVRELS